MNSTVGYLTSTQCNAQKEDLGIKDCCPDESCSGTDYWAGAVAYCGGVSNMPTMEDLALIGSNAYDVTLGQYNSEKSGTPNEDILTSYGFPIPGSYGIWSGEENSSDTIFDLHLHPTRVLTSYNPRSYAYRYIFCVEE